MKPPQKAEEILPGQDPHLAEYQEREAHLKQELEAGAISAADYRRLKEEAWNVYQNRSGRLVVDEERRNGG